MTRDGAPSERRWACVDVPALPLQILVREHPEWFDRPAAVVNEDRPQGRILWVNERAWRARVLPGLRYAAALALCHELCAAEVPAAAVAEGVERLKAILRGFSPGVEADEDEPGIFWLDATGLQPLERSLESWAERIRTELAAQGFRAHVVVGFSRFGTYALARSTRAVLVLEDPAQERRAALEVPVDRLHLPAPVRERLARLAVHTLGQLLALPVDGLARRFGPELLRLVRRARGDLREPLRAEPVTEPLRAVIELEFPLAETTRVCALLERVLPPLLREARRRGQGVTGLRLRLHLDHGEPASATVRTAGATRDAAQILELIRLRLATIRLQAGVVEIEVELATRPLQHRQQELFGEFAARDPEAAARAFARLRVEFGDEAVVRARLHAAHLPEASFRWQPIAHLPAPEPRGIRCRSLVRRIFMPARPLPHRGHHEPDGWLVRGPEEGPMVRIFGPYLVSGGWWVREVHRAYHFAETGSGSILWVYYDRRRRRWFLHGTVE